MHPQLPPLGDESRKQFHAIFNHWLADASEAEHGKLEDAKGRYAPFQVCSMVTLVRGCLADQALRTELPETLVQLLRERNWLRPSSVVIAV